MSRLTTFSALALMLAELDARRIRHSVQEPSATELHSFNFEKSFRQFDTRDLPQRTTYGIFDITIAKHQTYATPEYWLFYHVKQHGVIESYISPIAIPHVLFTYEHTQSLGAAIRYISYEQEKEMAAFKKDVIRYALAQEPQLITPQGKLPSDETHNLLAPENSMGFRAKITYVPGTKSHALAPQGLVANNLHQIHWRYPSPMDAPQVAFESNEHGTGFTHKLEDIVSVVVTPSTTLHEQLI